MFFIYLLSGLYLGWSLGANNTGNIFGAAVETKMIKFKNAALIAAIFVTLGAVLEGSGASDTLGELGSVDALGGAFTVSLAAALSITSMVRSGIPVSINQTIVGAIIGWSLFTNRLLDPQSVVTIASSWVFAFLLSAAIAFLLFHIVRPIINRSKVHLLRQDLFVRYLIVAVGAFGAYALGANNMASIVGVYIPVSPFKDISIAGIYTFKGTQQLYLLGAISVVIGIYTYSHKVMKTVGKDIFRLSPVTALIAIFAESLVLFFFASRGLHNLLLRLGLPTFPLVSVSSTHVIVGAIVGIGLAKGGRNIRYDILGKLALTWIIAPILAALMSFIMLFIMQNVFEQKVQQETHYVFDRVTVTRIADDICDISLLSPVNGREFTSEREIYGELKNQEELNRESIVKIIAISELFPLEVSLEKLQESGYIHSFNDEQLAIIKTLEGRNYRHKWELRDALEKHSVFESVKEPKTGLQKNHNKELDNLFSLLYHSFRPGTGKK